MSRWRAIWHTLCSCTTKERYHEDGKRVTESEDSDSAFERAAPQQIPSTSTKPVAGNGRRTPSPAARRRTNQQLQLHKVGTKYRLENAEAPLVRQVGEVLIEVQAIGLNPIDWKSPKFGFGIPEMPFVSGREFVGRVVDTSQLRQNEADVGDVVLAVSTDYRDYRKAAFQRYAVSSIFNTLRIPSHIPIESVAGIGVAFAVAAISLGVCFGAVFPDPDVEAGLDLLILARSQPKHSIPEDVWGEVFQGINQNEKIRKGDWLLVYGASAITGQMTIQLAKLAGLRVIAVADLERHEQRLTAIGADLVFDRHDLDAARERIIEATNGDLKFAIDAVGKETADWCHNVLHHNSTPSSSVGQLGGSEARRKHLVGLSGLPKALEPSVQGHSVPIKIFHSNAVLGRTTMSWLQALLKERILNLPEVDVIKGGLQSVNKGLERLERGEASGKRIIVSMESA